MSNPPLVIETETVTVKPRKLSAKWTVETAQDLEAMHGTKKPKWFWQAWHEVAKRMKWGAGGGWEIKGPWDDWTIEDELTQACAEEITKEIDAQILKDLAAQFKHQGS